MLESTETISVPTTVSTTAVAIGRIYLRKETDYSQAKKERPVFAEVRGVVGGYVLYKVSGTLISFKAAHNSLGSRFGAGQWMRLSAADFIERFPKEVVNGVVQA